MRNSALFANVVIAIVILICYTVLTALDHDGTPLLTILVGQGIAAGVAKSIDAAKANG